MIDMAATSAKLRRIFVWGSFVTAKPTPKDVDVLLIMDTDFEVEDIDLRAQSIFDSVRARLLFEADVFWARASIGDEVLSVWLETYQISRSFQRRGIVELELP
jgi:predicted nucleotidyltransferase